MQQDHAAKTNLIRGLMAAGRVRELCDLLRGLSPFCEPSPKSTVELASIAETKLVAAARGHLAFVAEYGLERRHVISNEGTHHFSNPERFEECCGSAHPACRWMNWLR